MPYDIQRFVQLKICLGLWTFLFFSQKKTPTVYFILSMGECMCINVCENNAVTEKLVTLCSGYWSISK